MKIKKYTLTELLQTLPVLCEEDILRFVGGGNGSESSPFTNSEFEEKCDNGTWTGGYVEGMGYVIGQVFCFASTYSTYEEVNYINSSNNYYEEYVDRLLKSFNYGSNSNFYSFSNSNYDNGSNNENGNGNVNSAVATVLAVDVLSTIGESLNKGTTRILDDRGKYLARKQIYRLDRPIIVRLPIGGIETTSRILNVVRVGGKFLGILGTAITLGETIYDISQGDNDAAWQNLKDAGIESLLFLIPYVGWACVITYEILSKEDQLFIQNN